MLRPIYLPRPLTLWLLAGALVVFAQQPSAPTSQAVPAGEKALLAELPVVEAASLHMQTLEEAPANVTIISAADIRKYGYRTLGEALAGVRGFDVTYDRIYHYVGVHGFSIPGDYNTRFLVMLNGHSLTENIFSSANFFGQDFGLDMDLIQRIEIVRGPSSALYGSNGMFATINIVTSSPVDLPKFRTGTETDTLGERKAIVSGSMYLGRGANLLISTSVFNNLGQSHYFPEFDSPATNYGFSGSEADGERGYHSFANLIWRDWNLIAYFNSREKQPPVGWNAPAIFAHPGNRVRDRRNFVGLSHSRDLRASGKLRWNISYDQYRYDDRFDYEQEDGIEDFRNVARGDWVASQLTYSFTMPKLGRLTLGTQANIELRNLQHNFAVSPAYFEQLRVSRPDRSYGLFAQQEYDLTRRWKAYFGLRFDTSHNFSNSLSPRLALVYQRSSKTVYKFVYGHPFRNPSVFEKYYNDGISFLPSQGLKHETAHTFEISAERKIRPDLAAIINVYRYDINDLIQTVLVGDGIQQYQNASSTRSSGIELELNGKLLPRLEAIGSFAWQRAQDTDARTWLVNSPRHLAKLRLAVPVLKDRVYLSSSGQYLGARKTLTDEVVRPVLLADVTFTTNRFLHPRLDLQCGVRNLLDRRYYDPIALAVDRMRGDGRSAFVKLVWRPVE